MKHLIRFIRSARRPDLLRRQVASYSVSASQFAAKYGPDDALLRPLFDQPATSHASTKIKPVGLFNNPYLVSPAGIHEFTEASLKEAQNLVSLIIDANNDVTGKSLKNSIKYLDRLSDVLCKVIDMVGFVRMSHPDPEFLTAAQQAHELMYEYMNVLNTSVELYQVLDRVLHTPGIFDSLSEEEKVVGRILWQDFIRSGVTLDPESRRKYVSLSNTVSIMGQQFITNIGPEKDAISVSDGDLMGMDPSLVASMRNPITRKVKLPTVGYLSDIAVSSARNESLRERLWLAQRKVSPSQIELLESFLKARGEVAKLMGYSSFAEYELQDKMTKTPAHVEMFLKGVAQKQYPLAQQVISKLLELKKTDDGPDSVFQAWDRDYYTTKYLNSRRVKPSKTDISLANYFSLGTVVQGLNRLFKEIYGLQLVAKECAPGEVWDKEVQRIDVVAEDVGTIGIIYCDLFQRDGKSPHPAHFTIQCSRRLEDDEVLSNHLPTLQQKDSGHRYQLPVSALVCDFVRSGPSKKVLLSYSEVETLFHEMGHAMHSMLGRTELHNVSGTRCATDFVELPSVLMESFAKSPQVLALYARHHETDEPLPYEKLDAVLKSQNILQHWETYNQVKLSLLDQALHSKAVINDPNFSSSKIYYDIENDHGLYPAHPGSQWQAQFGHLFGYGATYYCYLFDRAIAQKVWSKLFEGNPISREAGEKFKNDVLIWGGSRDPWKCVADALDEPSLAKGDEAAISWLAGDL